MVKDNLLTTLYELDKEFFISFEFKATEYTTGYQKVVHFTEGGNCCNVGQRVPSLQVKDSGKLHPAFAVNGNGNYYKTTTKEYPVDQWHQVEFSQTLENGKYIYTVKINGVTWIEMENEQPKKFSNVKVYAADPWETSLKGTLKNLIINTDGQRCGGKNIFEGTECFNLN